MEYTENKTYNVDISKAETLEDIINILKHLDLHYTPENEECFEEIKHMLVEKGSLQNNICSDDCICKC